MRKQWECSQTSRFFLKFITAKQEQNVEVDRTDACKNLNVTLRNLETSDGVKMCDVRVAK